MMTPPYVSVIMPCYNHGRFVRDSVRAILAQTHSDLELIIVDDHSKDDSWDEISKLALTDPRIRPIRHERNLGASKSRNDGMRVARGGFIGFCDADDLWEPEKLRTQLRLLTENPGCDLTYSDALIVDEHGTPTGRRFSDLFLPPREAAGQVHRRLLRENFINIQCVLMRRECMDKAGVFDEQIKWVEDWWYWIRLAMSHRFLYSPLPLARYRVHSRSTNVVQKRGYCVNRFKVFRRILRTWPDLPRPVRAESVFNLGVELCTLGKYRSGRRLLWGAAGLSVAHPGALGTFARAIRRLVITPRSAGQPANRTTLEPSERPVA